MDVFLYNGSIARSSVLRFVRVIDRHKKDDTCLIILVTPGGEPDAAYKMARYLQSSYKHYSVLVSGPCKSAGTLFAIGANELVFAPFGELGPLDIQLKKTDNLASMASGLNISQAIMTLENAARSTFVDLTMELISTSGGIVSFPTASHSAYEFVQALYGPIFSRIDPEEVGSRTRSLAIADDYGARLDQKATNLKPDALSRLSRAYPSHSFVIDFLEASVLFNRVRLASDQEMAIIDLAGSLAYQIQDEARIQPYGQLPAMGLEDEHHEEERAATHRDGNPDDRSHPSAADEAQDAATGAVASLKVRRRPAP